MKTESTYKIILSGGGTGGHIYPAIAIANALKLRYPNAEFLFVGAKDKMEMEKVPQAGYAIKGLWIAGLQRKLSFKNILFPIKLISSLYKANTILKQFKPHVVIGTGGFASGPLLYMATLKKIPTLIQEQNSYPGITNKLLGKKVNKVCTAYQGLEQFFPKSKIVITGNPVRQDIMNTALKTNEANSIFNLNTNKTTLLVLGGSLGARRINELIEKELEFFSKNNVQVLWQCGKNGFKEFQKYQALAHVSVFEYINTMDLAYAAAHIIISRAGASTVSELCVVGKPTIFIPSPHVAEDHQTKNAIEIVKHQAAIVIKEFELNKQFETTFKALLDSKEMQENMGSNMKAMAKVNATQDIVNEIEKLLITT